MKLDKFDYGLERAVSEIILGALTPIIVSIFFSTRLIPLYFILIFHAISIIDMIGLIHKMSYWGTSYIFGWLVGVIILAYANLLTPTTGQVPRTRTNVRPLYLRGTKVQGWDILAKKRSILTRSITI